MKTVTGPFEQSQAVRPVATDVAAHDSADEAG